MTTFYIAPSSLTYKQYSELCKAARSFGWTSPWIWAREVFNFDFILKSEILTKSIRAISRSDIFIAYLPGTFSTCVEIGMAYTLCEEVFLAARDPVHFTQTGLADSHLAALPGIRRVCCETAEIPAMLQQEYLYLIDTSHF